MISTFGNRFKKLRMEKGLKQQELIDEYNKKYHYSFTRAAVSQYENDKRIPEIDALKSFADYFDVSVDYLLGNSDIKKYNSAAHIFPGSGNPNNDNSNGIVLTPKDHKDIEKVIEQTKKELQNTEGLMFDGEPATEEAIQSILQAMEMGMALAKQKNKEKYTPKKYKK